MLELFVSTGRRREVAEGIPRLHQHHHGVPGDVCFVFFLFCFVLPRPIIIKNW